jgi:hypothetical protein
LYIFFFLLNKYYPSNSFSHILEINFCFTKIGAPTPVRTGNLRLRRPALYPVELWALNN